MVRRQPEYSGKICGKSKGRVNVCCVMDKIAMAYHNAAWPGGGTGGILQVGEPFSSVVRRTPIFMACYIAQVRCEPYSVLAELVAYGF